MQQVVLRIRDEEKAEFLLDFLRQLDFIEIIEVRQIPQGQGENEGIQAKQDKKGEDISPKIGKMEGIWKGLGFEKITDLESEIRKIRGQTGQYKNGDDTSG